MPPILTRFWHDREPRGPDPGLFSETAVLSDVDTKEVAAVTEVVEVDCIHWLWPSYAVVDGVDVPHWLIYQEGENA
jgi:hypothetical protein